MIGSRPLTLEVTGARSDMSDDKGKPPYQRTGKLKPSWRIEKMPDGTLDFDEATRHVRDEICAAMGLPAWLFLPPVEYRDPYPEEGE